MIRTTKIQADCLVPGDFYVEKQRGGPDCHVLFIREVTVSYFPSSSSYVRLTSASGETRRLNPADEVEIMVKS